MNTIMFLVMVSIIFILLFSLLGIMALRKNDTAFLMEIIRQQQIILKSKYLYMNKNEKENIIRLNDFIYKRKRK